jgi:hypothetical protein
MDALNRSLAPFVCLLLPWKTWSQSSWKQRHDANKRAAALETFNAELSPIYKLPPELNHEVLQYLSVVDIMSLRLSSRRYVFLTWRHKLTLDDKQDMKARLRRDRYFKLAQAEIKGPRKLSSPLCSYCLEPHPSSMFQRREIVKSPQFRRCIGSSRLFRACPHRSLTRKEFMATMNSPFFRYCNGCSTVLSFTTRTPNNNNVIYGSDCTLGFSHISCIIYRSEVQRDLRQLAHPICPHMRTDDPHFLDRVLSSPRGDWSNNFDNDRPVDDVFAEPYTCTIMRISCQEELCDSTIDIDRRGSFGQVFVKTRIRRNLGNMAEALDPKWLIQLEE